MASPETYADVFGQLERHGVRYVVTGGVAVVLHGHDRPVADLDIVIDPDPEQADLALRALLALGFVPSIPLPPSAVTVLRLLDSSQREIDIFFRYRISFIRLWADAQPMPVGESNARVMSLEHLLRTKQLDGRSVDLADLHALRARDSHDDNPTDDFSGAQRPPV